MAAALFHGMTGDAIEARGRRPALGKVGLGSTLRRWRQRAQRVVPVVQPIRRQDRSEPHRSFGRQCRQAGRVAAAGHISVGRGYYARLPGRKTEPAESVQRDDGPRSHPAGGRGIQRVAAGALDRRQIPPGDQRRAAPWR